MFCSQNCPLVRH